jgi:nucleotide-binding universal stress UspA family protein
MATGNLASVVVAVDGSEESMNALQWALDNLRLRPDGELVVLHVQPLPNIAAGLNPAPIPFGGPSKRINPVSPCSLVTVALVHLVRDRA